MWYYIDIRKGYKIPRRKEARTMTTMQKLNLIATKPEAMAMAETLMKNKSEANLSGMDTMSIVEIADLVISKFFANK